MHRHPALLRVPTPWASPATPTPTDSESGRASRRRERMEPPVEPAATPPPIPVPARRSPSLVEQAVSRVTPTPSVPSPGPIDPLRQGEERLRVPDRAQMDRWVARLREGDEGALREVVEAFRERITAVVAGVLRDRDAVDDVVQETFVKAYTRIAAFKGEASLFTWLYRIAVNAAKDHAKARRRRPATSIEDLPTGAGGLTEVVAAPPVERLEVREQRLLVRRAVDRLPTVFRTVLVLRELEGLRYEEIARILGISLGTVESRLFRARRRLRALLTSLGVSA